MLADANRKKDVVILVSDNGEFRTSGSKSDESRHYVIIKVTIC